MHNWFVYKEFSQASQAAADFIGKRITACLQQKALCHVVLPGGNTPVKCLQYLADMALSWDKIRWYMGDERNYPKGHPDRNDVMLQKYFWSRLTAPHAHTIPIENGIEAAAEAYSKVIDSIGTIDIAFLGMGEDGHTASLFPENKALSDLHSVVPVYNSPKPPGERVSLSLASLKKAKYRLVLTTGSEKASAITQIKAGKHLPINCIGDINWFVDETAVSTT